MSNTTRRSDDLDAHLAEVEDGAGCTEIWETLSERRDGDAQEVDSEADPKADAE
ncbi:hypothetical protein HUG10_14670 [Halorarum halophilum]|uniref:Uncharacterized protein n=1 Tax=Halorarum halophilum TaxID=2743090 RepID=A0A7D5GG18_9EURY|nr:hypothetical protein [Halobaculum halophilum]QLG28708.1 hypothetical protein HUG10_14670 [Halobaculum halophilum]